MKRMDDLISRQEAIDALGEEPEVWDETDEYAIGQRNQWRSDKLAIEAVPSVERKKGRWERTAEGLFCSCCYLGWAWLTGVPVEVETGYKFCPNCGAEMKGEET